MGKNKRSYILIFMCVLSSTFSRRSLSLGGSPSLCSPFQHMLGTSQMHLLIFTENKCKDGALVLILQISKLSLREGQWLSQSDKVRKWARQAMNTIWSEVRALPTHAAISHLTACVATNPSKTCALSTLPCEGFACSVHVGVGLTQCAWGYSESSTAIKRIEIVCNQLISIINNCFLTLFTDNLPVSFKILIGVISGMVLIKYGHHEHPIQHLVIDY